MVNSTHSDSRALEEWEASAAYAQGGDRTLAEFDGLIAAIRRQWKVVALGAFIGALLGGAYAITAAPKYTATATVLVDKGQSQFVDQQLSLPSDMYVDDGAVMSQAEIIKGRGVGLSVVDALDLTHNQTFMASRGFAGSLGAMWAALKTRVTGADAVAGDPRQAAFKTLTDGLTVERVDKTYVINVSFTSTDRELAARVANAVAQAYLADELSAKNDTTKQASVWLSDRIGELRQKSIASDEAVQAFRSENGLVSANGQIVPEQQMTEINTQLVQAQADTAQAKAKYDEIEQVIQGGDADAIVSEALDSPVFNDLRTKYLVDKKTEAALEARLGPDHMQVTKLQAEADEYKHLMFGELSRIGESYKNAYNVALARETALENSLSKSVGQNSAAGQTEVALRQLQREGDTYRDLYQSFLQRYQQALQQQSFPIVGARVISTAPTPSSPTQPKKTLDVGLAAALGICFGAMMGLAREYRERYFRTGAQVAALLGIQFLGLLPLIGGAAPGAPRGAGQSLARRTYRTSGGGILQYAVDNATSVFAETIRSIRIAADAAVGTGRPICLGVASSVANEGKSTVAANLAAAMSAQNSRVLLVDGDVRNPDLSRSFAPGCERGLLAALAGEAPLEECFAVAGNARFAFLPIENNSTGGTDAARFGAVQQIGALLAQCREKFDYVILDLPPLGPVADVRALAPHVDAVVLVIEWGVTPRLMVQELLGSRGPVGEKCIGAVLNKVDMNQLAKYENYGGAYAYYSYAADTPRQ
jgi:succinoglycan biosynthesis transport protein ExoP